MAITPKVKICVEMTPDINQLISDMALERRLSKSGFIKQSIFVMKKLIDAKKEGSNLVLISANGEKQELAVI